MQTQYWRCKESIFHVALFIACHSIWRSQYLSDNFVCTEAALEMVATSIFDAGPSLNTGQTPKWSDLFFWSSPSQNNTLVEGSLRHLYFEFLEADLGGNLNSKWEISPSKSNWKCFLKASVKIRCPGLKAADLTFQIPVLGVICQ